MLFMDWPNSGEIVTIHSLLAGCKRDFGERFSPPKHTKKIQPCCWRCSEEREIACPNYPRHPDFLGSICVIFFVENEDPSRCWLLPFKKLRYGTSAIKFV